MDELHRRSVMATLATSGVLTSIGVGSISAGSATETTGGSDDSWWTPGGNAGNTRAVSIDEFGSPDTVAWQYDETGEAVAVDGRVYLSTPFRGVHALDAADGSVEWKADGIDPNRAPTVVGDTVYVNGQQVTALDHSSGAVRWQWGTEVDGDPYVELVASETVYALVEKDTKRVNKSLYALESTDGSVRWTCDAVSVETNRGEQTYSVGQVVARNGRVFATLVDDSGDLRGLAEFDPETGETVWEAIDSVPTIHDPSLAATADRLYVGGRSLLLVFDPDLRRPVADAASLHGPNTLAIANGIGVTQGGWDLYGWTELPPTEYFAEPSWEHDERPSLGRPSIVNDTVVASKRTHEHGTDDELLGFCLEKGCVRWRVVIDSDRWGGAIKRGPPVISGDTVYINMDDGLTAFRPSPDDDGGENDTESENDDGNTGETDDSRKSNESDSVTDGEETATGTGDEATDGDENQTSANGTDPETEDDADGTPGFTIGAGLASGVLSLAWLRDRIRDETPPGE